MKCIVVAEYSDAPTEGMNVISRTLVDDLRARGHEVSVVPPRRVVLHLWAMVRARADVIVFTHGPGARTVLASCLLRLLAGARIVWVATRPDLAGCPRWLQGWKSAHLVICNRRRGDIEAVAPDARVVVQPIGIDTGRLGLAHGDAPRAAPRQGGVPVALHVGHLRASRGLEALAEVKARLGDRIEVVVQASPRFAPDPQVMDLLQAAGVQVVQGHAADIGAVYRAADLYLFPVPPEAEGAIDLPLSVLEAMACRVPVIATPFGALPDLIGAEPGVTLVARAEFVAAVAAWVDREPAGRPRPRGLPEAFSAGRITDLVLERADG